MHNGYNDLLYSTSSSKGQDYHPFRSSSLIQEKVNYSRSNSYQSYIQNKFHVDGKSNIQEYFRYRNAQDRLSAPILEHPTFIFPSYINLKSQSRNDYSRFKNSQSLKQSPTNGSHGKLPIRHKNCRSKIYSGNIKRFPVPDNKVDWNVQFPDYQPLEFTTDKIKRNPRADSCNPWDISRFNKIDNKIDRRSFLGLYHVDSKTNRPRNPMGRTGITGRGRLYYWGPNHAGDSVITRWLRDENDEIVYRGIDGGFSWKPVLEFVAIRRKDTKQWALPGGMVDPGEEMSETVKREFQEEAMQDGVDPESVEQLFSNGYKVYESYADDPRNTDNAWLETVAINYHDETGELTKHIGLSAGDDADQVVWCSIDRHLNLYGCHKDILKNVVDRLDAYW